MTLPKWYLSSLRYLSRSCLLLLWLLFLSGFLYVPFPGQHGFNGLFDRPTVDLFVLKEKPVLNESRDRWQKRSTHNLSVSLPFLRRFYMVWASDGLSHFHPAPHRKTSCSESETCIMSFIHKHRSLSKSLILKLWTL